ncbi:MAG: NAD-dependent epimerase/dehydratase family protein [Bacteroidetes bacterium]|nr:NAD-dependent epimerase/dehydratase family protein [Bacteroidota bacterium]
MITAITGGTGFIGSHLVDRLLEQGHQLRVLVRKTSNLRWLQGKNVQLVEGDIRDAATLGDFIRDADYVYHIAGVVKARDRAGYFDGNVKATENMLEAVRRFAPNLRRFLYVSSQTAAGPASSLDRPIREDDQPHPITTYGESKVAAEHAVHAVRENIPWTIVRPPAMYGPRDTEIFIYFQAIARGLNSMIGFDDKRLSLLHCDDLVRGMILAAESENSIGGTYFISSEEFYSWPQVGRITAGILGSRYLTVRLPHSMVYSVAGIAQFVAGLQKKPATLNLEKARDITQRYWICDVSKAKRDLGYRQEVSIEEGIRGTVEWYRRQGWLKAGKK